MSPLAKIFVVVNLILSVAFFGSSATLFATRVNWKQEAVRFKTEAEKLLKDQDEKFKAQATNYQGLAKDHAKLQSEFAGLTADKVKVDGVLQETKTKLSNAENRIETEVKEKTMLTSRLQALEKNNTDLGARVEALTKEATDSKASEEKARSEMTRARLDLDKSNEELSKTLIELTDTRSKLDSANMSIAAALANGVDLTKLSAAPPIDAVVEAVKLDDMLVVLSVGKDQKVQEGFEFTIYRGDRFVGKVKVTKVYENLSGARILFTNDNESIQIGDKAATQI